MYSLARREAQKRSVLSRLSALKHLAGSEADCWWSSSQQSSVRAHAYTSASCTRPVGSTLCKPGHTLQNNTHRATGPTLNPGKQLLPRRGFAISPEDFDLLVNDEHLARVDGYGENGFLVNGVEYHSPIVCFGKLTFAWHVNTIEDINLDSLAIINLLKPAPDVVIFGTGTSALKIPDEIIQAFRKNGTNVDIMNTANACTTFNILNQESRSIACALLLDRPGSSETSP